MRVANAIAALCVALLGIIVAVLARQLPYDAEYGPGPGFLPFWLGVTLIVLSVFLLRDALRMPNTSEARAPGDTDGAEPFLEIGPGAMAPWLIFVASMAVFAVLFEQLGFALATGLFMLVTMRWVARQSWLSTIVFSVITPVTLYIGFAKVLLVPLQLAPAGF
jgi:putative tricarboxylic transport membrane protein